MALVVVSAAYALAQANTAKSASVSNGFIDFSLLVACKQDKRLRRVYGIGARRGNVSPRPAGLGEDRLSQKAHDALQHRLCQNPLPSAVRTVKMMFLH